MIFNLALDLAVGDRFCVNYPISLRWFRAIQHFARFLKQKAPGLLLAWVCTGFATLRQNAERMINSPAQRRAACGMYAATGGRAAADGRGLSLPQFRQALLNFIYPH